MTDVMKVMQLIEKEIDDRREKTFFLESFYADTGRIEDLMDCHDNRVEIDVLEHMRSRIKKKMAHSDQKN